MPKQLQATAAVTESAISSEPTTRSVEAFSAGSADHAPLGILDSQPIEAPTHI